MRYPVLSLSAALLAGLALAAPAACAAGGPLDGLSELRPGTTQRAASTDADWRNGPNDSRPIAPGQTIVLADLRGPGVIHHIWNTEGGGEPHYSRLLRVRMYWDGEAEPSVDCPLGDFFAVGHGLDADVDSLPVSVSSNGRARNCYWPMPFRKSARVTVTNEGKNGVGMYWYVDWERVPRLAASEAYFHAQYRQAYPVAGDENYLVADIAGKGHYVGTVLNVHSHASGWWGEGDDHFYVDGEAEPSVKGTGTEDYFSQAYGVFPQHRPWYGTPVWESNEAEDGRTTVYRWQAPNPVRFSKSLRFELEHKGVTWKADGTVENYNGVRHDDFSSVAYWYQTEPHKPFPPMPIGYDRLDMDAPLVLEGETLASVGSATAGSIERQDLPGRSGGAQLYWTAETPNQALTLPVAVPASGRYNVELHLTRSWDYGVFQIEWDGKPMGEPTDLYQASISETVIRWRGISLSPGKHVIRFVNKGRNDQSKGVLLGLDDITLTRWKGSAE
jgi:hypothetical protein